MAHFDAHLRYSDVGLLILKFCCMCNKVEYMYMNTRQRTKVEGAEGVESGEGLCPLPPRKIFDDLILKWMAHFDAYLRYSDIGYLF